MWVSIDWDQTAPLPQPNMTCTPSEHLCFPSWKFSAGIVRSALQVGWTLASSNRYVRNIQRYIPFEDDLCPS
jgi:hypothetical protein